MTTHDAVYDDAAADLATEMVSLLGALRGILTPTLRTDPTPQAVRTLERVEQGSRCEIPPAEFARVLHDLARDLVTLRNARLVFRACDTADCGIRIVAAHAGTVAIGAAITALVHTTARITPELALSLAQHTLRTDQDQRRAIARLVASRGIR